MTDPPDDTTRILADLCAGREQAADDLLPLVYGELRALAASYLRQERSGHTLQPTALVHEAYLRLVGQTRVEWQGRAHFIAVAAEAIRRVLVDHARKRHAAKRGNDPERLTLSGVDGMLPERPEIDLIALDDALGRLATWQDRQAQVVKLRFFGGLSWDEIAYVLGASRSTVTQDWTFAKAWLLSELAGDAAHDA